MRRYRLWSLIGTGVLVAGAAVLSSAPVLAQRGAGRDDGARAQSGASRPAPSARESAPARPTFTRSAPSVRAPAASRAAADSAPTGHRFGQREAPRTFGGGISGRGAPARPTFDPGPRAPSPVDTRPAPSRQSPTDRSPDRGGATPPGARRAPSSPRTAPETWRSGGGVGAPSGGVRAPIRQSPGMDGSSGSRANPGGASGRDTRSRSDSGRDTRSRGDSPSAWRAPSRTTGSPGPAQADRGRPAPSNTPPSWQARPGQYTYLPSRSLHRPPSVNRARWNDRTRFDGSRFRPVQVGYRDPWYIYQAPSFSNVRFYYPFYYAGPFVAGFYYSPFWGYGSLFPTYIYPERVIVVERRIYLRDVVSDDNYYDPYSDATSSLRDTMDDIKSAWTSGDGGLLLDHINDAMAVRIVQKGDYKYSLEPDDYRDITKDALNRVETTGFEWTKIDRASSDLVNLEAKHTFKDADGDGHTIRLTYTLEKSRGGWWITETGTAPW